MKYLARLFRWADEPYDAGQATARFMLLLLGVVVVVFVLALILTVLSWAGLALGLLPMGYVLYEWIRYAVQGPRK